MKNFLDISDLDRDLIDTIINSEYKKNILSGKNIGLIFEKPSTRTRISFAVAINNSGGNYVDIKFNELNISRYETFEDTFKAMSCYLDGLIFRTTSHERILMATKFFEKPIINALSDKSHPCQTLSDLLTLKEHFGNFNINILWMGDMNNVCFSLVEAVNLIKECQLIICCPDSISKKINWRMGSNINVYSNLNQIPLDKINCVMTDVFISMNDKDNNSKINLLKPYSVTSELMKQTKSDSIFMHCLPAKIGLEVSKEVFNSSKSIVWKQAYNRMISQKKLLQLVNWE